MQQAARSDKNPCKRARKPTPGLEPGTPSLRVKCRRPVRPDLTWREVASLLALRAVQGPGHRMATRASFSTFWARIGHRHDITPTRIGTLGHDNFRRHAPPPHDPRGCGAAALSTSTVRRRIWDGELPAVRLGLRPQAPVGIDPAELERWISSSKRPAGAGESGRSPHGGLEART